MSAPRRSSSPLSSASPSPVTGPIVNSVLPPTLLNLGVPAAPALDHEGDIIGGSSPTTLTDPLTESELTEDEGDDNDEEAQDQDAPDADEDDDVVNDEEARRPPILKRRSGVSPSPSLTPPPPSDPPRSEALPSSPLPVNDNDNDDDPMDQDEDPEPADDPALGDGAIISAAKPEADAADGDEEDDGDVTMRADEVEVKQEALIADADGDGPADAEPEAMVEAVADAEADVEEGAVAEPEPEAEAEAEVVANGDDDAAEEEEEAEAQEDSPAALPSRSSAHVAPPTPQATRALLALEIKFAALRDRLYVERLEEAAREEEMILNGSHPALLELNKVLESRRERLHEIALRRYEESLNDLAIWRDMEKKISWSTWADQRDQIHWEEFEHTWSKRRRLAREKNEIETPKVHKAVPRADKPPRPFNWSAGAIPHKLSTEDALHDLQLMDVRRNQPQQHASRHASPAVYSSHAGPSSGYSYQQQHPASYLQNDTSEADRRHHYTPTPRQHPRPPSQPQAVQSNPPPPQPRPMASASGPSALPRKTLGSDAFGIPRREPPPALQSNGDSKLSNGHGHGRHATSQNVLGLGLTPGAAADSKPTTTVLGASSSAQNASSRFPGLADYLSGSATPPQNSFQHHFQNNASTSASTAAAKSSSTATKSASSVPTGTSTSLGTAGLGRPSFAAPAAPQPQAASVPRN